MIRLNNGAVIPQLAFGTYKVSIEECETVIECAIKAGYRHFDCASIYGNEIAVGKALHKSGISRNKLYICSKVWNDAQRKGRGAVRASLLRTLNDLMCEYLDMYLVHWPVPGHHIDTYKELEELYEEGLIRSIGLSNYSQEVCITISHDAHIRLNIFVGIFKYYAQTAKKRFCPFLKFTNRIITN